MTRENRVKGQSKVRQGIKERPVKIKNDRFVLFHIIFILCNVEFLEGIVSFPGFYYTMTSEYGKMEAV